MKTVETELEKLVEHVATAIWEAGPDLAAGLICPWADLDEIGKEEWRVMARAAIKAVFRK